MSTLLLSLLILCCCGCNQETGEQRFEKRIDRKAPEAQEKLIELKEEVNIEAQELQEKVEQRAKEKDSKY